MTITYDFTFISGGHNVGVHPWRDWSDETYAYQLRDVNNDQSALEFVQINVETGVVATQGPTWAYSAGAITGTLGACFSFPAAVQWDSNIAGSVLGTKLYIAASSQNGGGNWDNVIIEFNKSDMTVNQHWTNGTNTTFRSGGTSIMKNDGTIFVRAGDNNTITGFIQVLVPATGNYAYISLSADLSISGGYIGVHSKETAAACFDSSGNLWFIFQPVDGSDIQTGNSTLYKATVSTANPPVITITNSYTIDDDYHPFGTGPASPSTFGQTFRYLRMTFNTLTNKLNMWSAWTDNTTQDFTEGWFIEFTPGTGLFTTAVNWTAGMPTASRARYDAIGRSGIDYLSSYIRNSGSTDAALNVFQISTGDETQYPLDADFSFTKNLNNATLMYSTGSFEIYAFDVDFHFVPGGTEYRDGLFTAIEPNPPPEPPPMPPTPPSGQPFRGLYFIERMDDRLWANVEEAWCLDCALALPQPTPSASITASSATGGANIAVYTVINGGSGYTAPTGQIFDIEGGGSGATVTLSISGGTVTSATAVTLGEGYLHPTLQILDTTGTGAVVAPIVTNYVTLSASANVFTSASIGDIVRMNSGKLEVIWTGLTSGTTSTVIANVLSPIQATPDDPDEVPLGADSGNWTMTTPTTTVSGLWHLEGLTVSALADGGVVNDLTVTDGAVTLPVEATAIVAGLPFNAQLQTLYVESQGGGTIQSRRKGDFQVVLRVENSRAPEVGVNQPDAAAQPGGFDVAWTQMAQVKERSVNVPPGQPVPLYSGDYEPTNVFGTWDTRGQVAVQQSNPLPLTVTAVIPWVRVADTPS